MRKLLAIFFRAPNSNPGTVLLCLLLAGLIEGIGLKTFLPPLGILLGDGSGPTSTAGRWLAGALDMAGIRAELETLLLIIVGTLALKSGLTILAMRHVGYASAEVSTGWRRQVIENLLRVRWS